MRREAKRIHQAGLPRLRKGNQSCRGQALIEIALVLWTFFVLAFTLIDFSWLMFSQMNMQDAVREAGRYASTGNHLTGPTGTLDTRIQSITQVLDNAAIAGNVANCTISINSVAGGVGNAGGPLDTVTIQAVCAIPLFAPGIETLFKGGNKFNFTVSSSFVNEPFPPSETL
jgi:Flp pilus assembly protein TadG